MERETGGALQWLLLLSLLLSSEGTGTSKGSVALTFFSFGFFVFCLFSASLSVSLSPPLVPDSDSLPDSTTASSLNCEGFARAVTEALGALLFFSPFRATFGSFTFDFAMLPG